MSCDFVMQIAQSANSLCLSPAGADFPGISSLKWLDPPHSDLSNSVDLFYSSLGKSQAAESADTLLRSIQQVCSMLTHAKVGCSASAAACVAIAALAQHAGSVDVYSSVCMAVSEVMSSLHARQGLQSTAMLLVLIGGLCRGGQDLPVIHQVAAVHAVTTAVPLGALMPGGIVQKTMRAWVHGTDGLPEALLRGAVLQTSF
jgi:hypothetical protein